jgi:hypothetical protein
MRKRDALNLHNRDEVEVRTGDGWEIGYVLGEPRVEAGRVIVPVQTQTHGWREVDHSEVR